MNAVKTYFTVAYPEAWLLILGGLFVIVTLFLPKGLLGLFDQLKTRKATSSKTNSEE